MIFYLLSLKKKLSKVLRYEELENLYEEHVAKTVCEDDALTAQYYYGIVVGLGYALGIPSLLTRWRIEDETIHFSKLK